MIGGERANSAAGGLQVTVNDHVPPHPHLPVSAGFATVLSQVNRQRLDRIAQEILADEPQIGNQGYFSRSVTSGLGPWPNLVIEDHSGIALYDPARDPSYAFRAMMLAGEGDLVVLPRRDFAFETYCGKKLGLGWPMVVTPAVGVPGESPALSCVRDPGALRQICRYAAQYGGLNIVPYMGSGNSWSLARAIAEQSGVPVQVAAPMPRLTQRVNNKLWFARLIGRVLGNNAEPVVRAAHGPASLAHQVRRLSRCHAGLAVRVPDAASSLGSIVVDVRSLDGLSLSAIAARLMENLKAAAWRGRFPLMVTAWEDPIAASPSVQIWIPKSSAGLPVIEAVFEQCLAGRTRAFSGAETSGLPQAVLKQIASQAGRLAYLLQQLGYYGRCSFDAVLVGSDAETSRIHWVECNGRWGGVSIPLTLAKRLASDGAVPCVLVLEERHQAGSPMSFDAVLRKLAGQLFVAGQRSRGVVILSPTLLEQGTGLMAAILGESSEALQFQAVELTQSLFSIKQ